MKRLCKYLRDQFAYVEFLDKQSDPDGFINMEVGEIVEEARRRCCEHGFDEIGDVATSLSPRSALPILGKLLAWAREEKSKTAPLTVPQIAKLLGVNADKVLHWIRTGELCASNVATRAGGRPSWRIKPTDLETFMRQRQYAPPPPRPKRRKPPAGVIQFY